MTVYKLSYGVELAGPVEGTLEELCELLDSYPNDVVMDVLIFERLAGSELYGALLPYAARRMVRGFTE